MQATLSAVLGIVVGVIVLAVAGRGATRGPGPAPKPTALGWSAFGFGVAALAAAGLMLTKLMTAAGPQVSISLAAATLVISIGALARRDRHWPTWIGLCLGAVPAAFWILFVVAEVIGPPH